MRSYIRHLIETKRETGAERERRERLEFFAGLPVAEQLRMRVFFDWVKDQPNGKYEVQLNQQKAKAATLDG